MFWQVPTREHDFVKNDKVSRCKFDTEIRAFDVNGGEHRFTPECHVSYPLCCKSSPNNCGFQFDGRVTQLKTFFDHIEAGHLHGKPLHITNPEASLFHIISYEEFQALSSQQIQDRLHWKNIVVTGLEVPDVQFDKAGLQAFCPMQRTILIQGTNSTIY